jgi:2-oxoglutarate/2-oxoacid ferredoxin oxidoreductase subunit alpha
MNIESKTTINRRPMNIQNRQGIKICGESGSLSTAGSMVVNLLRQKNYYIFSEREFPSLIKGGRASFNINFAALPIRSLSEFFDIGLVFDKEGMYEALDSLENCFLLNGFDRYSKIFKTLDEDCQSRGITLINIPVREILDNLGAPAIMTNTILVGALVGFLSLEFAELEYFVTDSLASKPNLIPLNIECAKAGYDFIVKYQKNNQISFELIQPSDQNQNQNLLIEGNSTLALGAIQAGLKAHYQYPMSPSTTVLVQLAQWSDQFNNLGIVVKQVEDEISAVQMSLGSMYGGIRAMTATSGGGFDLMTETVSLAAMIEVPMLTINVQRPGPATGLPTWTAQADLNLAIHSGHGEYAKVVIGCSDQQDCFRLIQEGFNLAERFQVPVIILSEATIAMSQKTVLESDLIKVPIERGLVRNTEDLRTFYVQNPKLANLKNRANGVEVDSEKTLDNALDDNSEILELNSKNRFELTTTGVSPRWIPTTSGAVYYSNGDEHWNDGALTEDADKTQQMISKRIRKLDSILNTLPEPKLYGKPGLSTTIVCWGSTKNALLDYLDIDDTLFNILHYEFLYPLRTEIIQQLISSNTNLILVEGNATGQLGELIASKTGYIFQNKFLKFNGRGFMLEDIHKIVDQFGLG